MILISLIPREALSEVWPLASVHIQRALDAAPGVYRVVDVLDAIINERETLWGVFDEDELIAVFTTMINEYPLCRRLMLHHVGGAQIDDWVKEGVEILKSYAKDTNCTGIDTKGRKGWIRHAKELGWSTDAAFYSMEI
jgi:hypothetical protein